MKKILYLLLISMLPVVELRGAVPVGAVSNVPWYVCYIVCVIGNMIPVPFLIKYSRHLFDRLMRGPLNKVTARIMDRVDKKKEKIRKWQLFGLVVFTMIPLPGTGAWTSSLIASAANIPLLKAVLAIFCGVLIAGLFITLASYGLIR